MALRLASLRRQGCYSNSERVILYRQGYSDTRVRVHIVRNEVCVYARPVAIDRASGRCVYRHHVFVDKLTDSVDNKKRVYGLAPRVVRR